MSDTVDPPPPSLPSPSIFDKRTQRISVMVVALMATLAAAWIASALWGGLLFGLLTAFAVEPAHRRIVKLVGGRRALAATLSVFIVVLGVSAVVSTMLFVLAGEAVSGINALKSWLQSPTSRTPFSSLEGTLATLGVTQEMLNERIVKIADRATETATGVVSLVLGSTFSSLGGALIAVLTAYQVLRDPQPIERHIEEFLPLHPRTTRELVEEFRKVGRGTLIGSVLAALAQGVLGASGYAIMHTPRFLLLGVATAIASFIPVVGTLLVWVPVGLSLIAADRLGAGIFELAWGLVITTGLVDYVLRPILAGPESRSHPLLFIIGLIGGVEILGAPGIIAGPIVMAIFASVIGIYRREVIDASIAQRSSLGSPLATPLPVTAAALVTPVAEVVADAPESSGR